jgi:hypothetical protein
MRVYKPSESIRIKPGERLATSLGNETVLLNLSNGTYYGLNETGSFVWNLLEKNPSRSFQLEELRDEVRSHFDVEINQCEQDLQKLIQDLYSNDLISLL